MPIEMDTGIVGVILLVMAIGVLIVFLSPPSSKSKIGRTIDKTPSSPIFLFDDNRLIDCTPAARVLLVQSSDQGSDWRGLMGFLTPRFPGVEEKLRHIKQLGSFSDVSHGSNGVATLLEAEFSGGLTKITLSDPDIVDGPGVAIAIAHRAATEELAILRDTLSASPVLTWRENADGDVVWANSPYMIMAAAQLPAGRDLSWPLPHLFDRSLFDGSGQGQTPDRQRQSVTVAGKQTAWFDVFMTRKLTDRMCFAIPADNAVTAETTLREFMQTLSKTFAQLPIGLAIFDKDRKLQMFNPALLDLTALPADFLSMRPSLLSVLDAMRERNLLPEPKDYRGWRKQMVEMERAAATGLFQENWALADGQTFRVTGRPHPNGALALMIEDISTEMQRTRRYRSDLELGHSVIDQMQEAIVVFSQSGQVMWSNTAYCQLWGHDPGATLGEMTIKQTCDHWKAMSAPNKIWAEIDEFVHTVGDRQRWRSELRLLDGRLISARVAPVASGATMIAFDTTLGDLRAAPESSEKLRQRAH